MRFTGFRTEGFEVPGSVWGFRLKSVSGRGFGGTVSGLSLGFRGLGIWGFRGLGADAYRSVCLGLAFSGCYL